MTNLSPTKTKIANYFLNLLLFLVLLVNQHILHYETVTLKRSTVIGRIEFSIKEIKNAPSALLSYISTREFLRTREKCGEARAEGECFSHFSSVLKNSRVLI